MLYQLALLGSLHLLFTEARAALAVYILCYWLVTPMSAAAAAEWMRLPQITRAAFGWLMDAYMADSCITFAAKSQPGAFNASRATAVPVRDRAVHSTSDQQHAEAVYLFACHPTGLLGRSAFCTFAARGWRSPVSGLGQVRLAVGSQAFRLPIALLREFLLACGCIPADREYLRKALASGCSIAITPGGWKEGRLFGSYQLVLKQRRGFLQLAQEAGALLVPVLCLGEQEVATAPVNGPLPWVYRLFTFFRPRPVKVVFGQVSDSTARASAARSGATGLIL